MKFITFALLLFPLSLLAAGSAALTWIAPTTNTDGSALTDLAGFNIYRGFNTTALGKYISVNAATLSYGDGNMAPGTYYYAVTAYNAAGAESVKSAVVSKIIAAPKPLPPTGLVAK